MKNQIQTVAELLDLFSRTEETAVEYFLIASDADCCTSSEARDANQWAAVAAVVTAETENGEIEEDRIKELATLSDVTQGN